MGTQTPSIGEIKEGMNINISESFVERLGIKSTSAQVGILVNWKKSTA
jgi:hypothetical protein